ncbi:hypothetical protein ASG49_07855 [Marmoricola sp. Leaf446]|uniref:hypothetical protein n=1 Tax=Marmoricola sp. Leaf446 TaxID=1736379 RepID=UPI0006F8869B|nr:hypothetical protein [Marmoricola sp. Leaf446]KQT94725.1 hypothetical protein ASG49_07855 [Marmoricola sp. Leaf446]
MTTTPDRRTWSRWLATGAAASAALAGVGLAGPAAQAEPTAAPEQCPAAVPVEDLRRGDDVTGRTVTSGTTPEAFTGTVLGVLEDGITSGVDMVLVDLHSTAVDRAGIWSGMSGSPVYAADGRLIGAVAYSLGAGPSTVAGVTPATEMYRLLTPAQGATTAPRVAAPLTADLQRSVARAGAATGATTMRRLRVPVGLSGLGAERVRSLAPALNSQGVHLADTAAGAPSAERIPVTAGGNLAASMAYGTLTAAAVGTATAVCGEEVLGFGHPMNFTGASTLSLHGASATHIQDDSLLGGFKVANIGAPIGTVDRDRLAGIRGREGALPRSHDVRTTATQGTDTRTALTHVTVGSLVPEMAFGTTIAAQDRVLDRVGGGQATTRWRVTGTRKDGSPFTYTRSNRYADPADISATTASALAMDLLALQDNPGEVVRITGVDAATTVEDTYATYRLASVQYLRGAKWVTLPRRGATLPQGRTVRLRVTLTSREAASRVVSSSITVPPRSAGRPGLLVVRGGGEDLYSSEDFFEDEEEFFGEDGPAPSAATFPALLKSLSSAPANDEVVTSLQLAGRGAAARERTTRVDADRVVGGAKLYVVRATR